MKDKLPSSSPALPICHRNHPGFRHSRFMLLNSIIFFPTATTKTCIGLLFRSQQTPFALASKYLFSSHLLLSKIPLVQLCHLPFSPPENLLQLHPTAAGVHPYTLIPSYPSTALHNTCPIQPCPVPATLLPALSQDNSSYTTHQPFCSPHPLLQATAFTLASDLHMAEPILACV